MEVFRRMLGIIIVIALLVSSVTFIGHSVAADDGEGGMETRAVPMEEVEPEEGTSSGLNGLSVKPAHMVLEDVVEISRAELVEETVPLSPGWQTMMSDGFEGAYPGVWDILWTYISVYWGWDDYNPHSGSFSAFCAKEGSFGVDPPDNYVDYMETWMIYGPFSLADATDARMDFYLWLDTYQYGEYDRFSCLASVDRNLMHFYGYSYSGYTDWNPMSFDLTDVPTLGNLCGEPQVWIAFLFEADDSNTSDGAFVDDVVLQKYVGAVPFDLEAVEVYLSTIPEDVDKEHVIDTPSVGQAVYLHFKWNCFGSGTTPTFRTDLKLDGTTFAYSEGTALGGYVYTTWSVNPWTATAGSHTLTGILDVNDDVSESSETNNEAGKSWGGTPPEATWTFMVYADGDNNLEDSEIISFNLMESAADNQNVNVIVQLDRIPGYDSSNGNWTTTRRYEVKHDTDMVNFASYTEGVDYWDLGELNMADPATLIDFVSWAKSHYPADHYCLALCNHGSGWKPRGVVVEPVPRGLVWDDTSGGDYLSTAELGNALNPVTSGGTEKLDVLFLDACLMQMIEVGYQVKDYSQYLVTSEYIGYGPGPYDDYLPSITMATTAPQLATTIVNEYHSKCSMIWDVAHTMSAVDLSQYGLASAVDDFAQALTAGLPTYRTQIESSRSACQSFEYEFEYDSYIDLYHFAFLIDQNITDTTIQNAAQAVMTAVNTAVIAEAHGNGGGGYYYPLDNAHGISIYFPASESDVSYTNYNSSNLAFVADQGWDEFLAAFFGVENTPPEVTNVTASQTSGIVEITYDVSDAEQSEVTISFEYWDGSSWQPCGNATGDGTQSTGAGKSGIWDANTDFDEHYMADCKIRVTADDGQAENHIFVAQSNDFTMDTKDPTGYGCDTPANTATDVSIDPNLTCLTASDDSSPVSYYFQLAEDAAFTLNLQESGWQIGTTWSPAALSYSTPYFWRVKAKDSYGNETDYGAVFSFNTEKTALVVDTDDASDITNNSAILNGSLASLGTHVSANVSFEWGITSGALDQETLPETMSSTDDFSTPLSNLAAGTTYYFRAKATGSVTVYGDELNFTTWTGIFIVNTTDDNDDGTPDESHTSLREAINAANARPGTDAIMFNIPGAGPHIIHPTSALPPLTDPVIIDGVSIHDVTIDGTNSPDDTSLRVFSSNVTITGLNILNFSGTGISIDTGDAYGRPLIERVLLQRNTISASRAIRVFNWGQGCTIRDINIKQNTLVNNGFCGIEIAAAMGPSMSNNEISNIKITENIISNTGYKIAIFAKGASDAGGTNNVLSGLEISNNTITGHTNSSILISAGNVQNCEDNRVDDVSITGNNIDGSSVTIEILGGVGTDANGNMTSNVRIIENTLQGGGIQLAGATGYNANQNGIRNVLIGWNIISNCTANGMHICAGAVGASNNVIEELIIFNNLITKNHEGAGILLHGEDSSSPDNTIDDVTILNNTIAENGNSWAGGININSKHTSNLITGVRVANTILWQNEGSDYIRGSLSPESVTFSVINDPRYVGTDGNFYSSPEFVEAAGGDYHLQLGSPCIDSGDNTEVPAWLTTDFEGDPRIFDGDGNDVAVVDIGADEYLPPPDIRFPIDPIGFGDVAAGTILDRTTIIFNEGGAYLIVNNITRNSGSDEFSYIDPATPFSIIAGESQIITIRFAPASEGLKSATFIVNSNDPDEPDVTFNVSGNGMPNTPPEVSNVTASQDSGIVNISYDVSDVEQSEVSISFEYWDGDGWQLCTTTTGEGTQTLGPGKSGTWNASADFNVKYLTDCKIKVTADDEQAENNISYAESSDFTLDTKPPTGYGCDTPTDTATGVSTNPGLTCLTASDDSLPVSYYFQLAENDTFSQGLQESGWQSGTTWAPSTLSYSTQYFWRVKAKDSYDNETDFGAIFSFTTAADTTPPYTSGHAPASGAAGVPIGTNIVVHVLDDGDGVDIATITMTVEGASVTPVITGTPADYTLTYDPPVDFAYLQVVDVAIDASDLANPGNAMTQDAYSFTTADKKTQSSGGGGGGGGSSGTTNLIEYMTGEGKFISDATAESADALVKISIPKDTIAKNRTGQRLRYVSIKKQSAPSDPPTDCSFICLTYDIGPNGSTFAPFAYLTFVYSNAGIPAGVAEENLVIATWQDEKWVELEGCIVDPVKNTITVPISHFSIFTAMANTSAAKFEVTGMTVTPAEVNPDAPVTVSVTVTNTGDMTDSYTLVLKIKDFAVQDKMITLKGGESQAVSFTMTPDTAGEYTVNVNGLLSKFTVKEPEKPKVEPQVASEPLLPKPVRFSVSKLSITPVEVNPSEEVTISAVVTNTGGSEGNYAVVLKINGVEERTKEVTIGSGKSEIVSFTIAKDTEGVFAVDIDGKTGQFTVIVPQPPTELPVEALIVQPSTNWPLIGGIIASGVIVVVLLAYFFVWRKRGKPKQSSV